MKIKFIAFLALLLSNVIYAQDGRVGINTTDPKTTLDIQGKTDSSGNLLTTDMTGLQAPRLTRTELAAKGDIYGNAQKGALIYITDATAPATPDPDAANQRVNIRTTGYFYFDGAFWQKITNGITSGDTTNDEWVNNTTGGRVELGKKSDGVTARPAGSEVVVQDDGKVGLGVTSPVTTLDIGGSSGSIWIRQGAGGGYPTSAGKGLKLESNSTGNGLIQAYDYSGNIATNIILNSSGGNVGIGAGAVTPSTKLHIDNGTTAGAIRIVDGTQGNGKILTSDANGVGTWATPTSTIIEGTWDSSQSSVNISSFTSTTWTWTGLSIVLPKGKYYVICQSGFSVPSNSQIHPYLGWSTTAGGAPSAYKFLGNTYLVSGGFDIKSYSCIIDLSAASGDTTIFIKAAEANGVSKVGQYADQFSLFAIRM